MGINGCCQKQFLCKGNARRSMERDKAINMKKEQTLIISLYGGPGSGTTMAGVFYKLKRKGINCEMAPEFAKEKVWEGSLDILKNQIYIFGKQLHSIERLRGKVDVIITDSPLLLSLVYGKDELPEFKDLVLAVHKKMRMINVYINRDKPYNPSGRTQDEIGAIELDKNVKEMLSKNNIIYDTICSKEAVDYIANKVLGTIEYIEE